MNTNRKKSAFGSLLALFVLTGTALGNSLIFNSDGDFSAQTVNTPLGAPWIPSVASQTPVKAAAQSPFTAVFADNGKGVSLASANPYPYWYQCFTNATVAAIPTNASGLLYFSFDFENTASGTAQWAIYLANNLTVPTTATIALYFDSSNLYAGSSGVKSASLMSLSLNTWYNVKLTLDMSANTYSGTVTPYGGSATAIASRTFNSENPISYIVSNWNVAGNGGVAHYVDNIAFFKILPPAGTVIKIQ